MSTLTNYAITILTSVLFTRWQTENTKIRDYYGSAVAAVIVWTLASFIWNKFIYVFYTSQLRHLPLIKRQTWSECFGLITAPTYLYGMDTIPNAGLLRRIDTLNQEVLVITTPEVAIEFFQKRDGDYVKWPAMAKVINDMLGHGLATVEGQEHRKQRKQMTPAFNPQVINALYPFLWSKASHCVSVMKSTLSAQAKTGSQPLLDMSDIAARVALDMMSEAGFGSSFKSLEEPDNNLNKWYRSAFLIEGNTRLIFVAMLLTSPKFVNMFTFIKKIRNKLDGMAAVRKWLSVEIDRRRKELEVHGDDEEWLEKHNHKNLVSAMVKSSTMSTDGLVEQSLTFLGAGHETSATSFTWGIHELAQPEHHKYQTALREEVRSQLPSPSSNTPITAELLESLPLLDAIVKENLRLHAPAPTTGRAAVRDTILSGCHVPKGTPVRLSPWAFGRSKKLWGEDAEVFRPERWFELKERLKSATPEELRDSSILQSITFGHGPRVCIGKGFALAELKALLAASVGSLEFKQIGDKHVDAETLFTIVGKIKDLRVEATPVAGW